MASAMILNSVHSGLWHISTDGLLSNLVFNWIGTSGIVKLTAVSWVQTEMNTSLVVHWRQTLISTQFIFNLLPTKHTVSLTHSKRAWWTDIEQATSRQVWPGSLISHLRLLPGRGTQNTST